MGSPRRKEKSGKKALFEHSLGALRVLRESNRISVYRRLSAVSEMIAA
jgi:hypothetical protein